MRLSTLIWKKGYTNPPNINVPFVSWLLLLLSFYSWKKRVQRAWELLVSHHVYTHLSYLQFACYTQRTCYQVQWFLFKHVNALKPCSINIRRIVKTLCSWLSSREKVSGMMWYIQLSHKVWIYRRQDLCADVSLGRARRWLIEPTCVRSAPRVRRDQFILFMHTHATNTVVFKELKPRGT